MISTYQNDPKHKKKLKQKSKIIFFSKIWLDRKNKHSLNRMKIHVQEKPKMTTMESLKFLVSSRYIRDLATLVVAYGISINLVEVTWKSKLKAQVKLDLIVSLPSFSLYLLITDSLCSPLCHSIRSSPAQMSTLPLWVTFQRQLE